MSVNNGVGIRLERWCDEWTWVVNPSHIVSALLTETSQHYLLLLWVFTSELSQEVSARGNGVAESVHVG